MENRLNYMIANNKSKQKSDVSKNKKSNSTIKSIKNNDINSNMARRYELAYTKLHNELPAWKKQSFNKNNKSVNDTLYNEFVASVIALAENSNDPILLTN